MDPLLTSTWLWALWKASEKVLGKVVEKSLDVAGKPIEEGLSGNYKKLAGVDERSRRQDAFVVAVTTTRKRTIERADDSPSVKRVLDVLDDRLSQQFVETLAEESAKVLLLSDEPDVARLASIFEQRCNQAVPYKTKFPYQHAHSLRWWGNIAPRKVTSRVRFG